MKGHLEGYDLQYYIMQKSNLKGHRREFEGHCAKTRREPSFTSLIIKQLIMVWVIKLLGKLFKPLQSLTSNISRSLWFHLEFLLFRITRNAIFSENLFMLVSIFSLIFFGGFFCTILAEASFFNFRKMLFLFSVLHFSL